MSFLPSPSPAASAPVLRFTTATAFLSDHDAREVFVPSESPAEDEQDPPASLQQQGHALTTSTFFPPGANGFISSRIVENGYTLELQWNSFSKGAPQRASMDEQDEASFIELDDEPTTLPPVRFVFPARLVPSPAFVVTVGESDARELQVYAVTETGYLFALRFTQPRLFYSILEGEDWSEEFKVVGLEGKLPVLVHGVDEARVIIACADGYAASVVIADGSNNLIETELRSASSFSVRSLIPSFSSRNLGSPSSLKSHAASSPSQVLSVASSTSENGAVSFAFAVSRDRKLKIWSLETGACLKAIDLPKPSSASSALAINSSSMELDSFDSPSTPRLPKAGLLLPPTPQPFVKLVAGSPTSPFASYLILFVPASSTTPPAFFIYGIANDEDSGALSELTPVGEKVCASSNAALVDFEAQPFSIGRGGDEAWTLWTAWEEGGESEVRFIALPELEGVAADEEEWTSVDRGSSASTAQWTTAYFDEILEGNQKGIAEVFVEHIAFPGRYPPTTLEYALATYEEAIDAELDDMNERPEALNLYYESVLERICAVVGSTVELEQSAQTGAYLYDAYNKRLKVEWLRFVAMLNQSRASALFPTSLAVDTTRRVAFVAMRDAISVPIVQETVLALREVSQLPEEDEQRRSFLSINPDALHRSYSHLAPRGPRSDLFTILSAIDHLSSMLSTAEVRNLEAELISKVRTPLTFSIEEVAIDIYERALEPYLSDEVVSSLDDKLRGILTPEASFQTLWSMLTTSDIIQPIRDEEVAPSATSDLSNALLTDGLATAIEARYQLVKGLSILLLFIYAEEDGLIPELASLTSASFATLHTLASLRWVAQQSAAPAPEVAQDQDVLERFGDMKVSSGKGQEDGDSPYPSFSLLNGLLRTRYTPPLSHSVPLPSALTHAMSSFLSSTGLLTQKRLVVDSPTDVEFALRLRQLGLPALALEFVDAYPRGAGMLYVRGLAQLDLGRFEEAQTDFLRAAPALYEEKVRLDEDSGVSRVLPFEVAGSLGRYYRHVVALFVEQGVDAAVVKFARLAIEALAEEGVTEETVEKDLWLKLFRSNAALGLYEEAYATLMSAPHEETKSSCLAHLISVMCENGEAEFLTRLSFVGLEADLERNLAFRARNSDPLASPNYYKILYAYHIAKSDYRSAGTIMFQQARRIGEMSARGGSFRELATLQCQSYLAAANALSLVAKEHAWIAVIPSDDQSDRSNKRRKITYEIPDEEFASSATRAPEIVELVDIRREYTIALSRLQLSAEFPELERTNFSLEPEAVVALFSQTGAFDQAFIAARTLDVDLSSLFEILVEKCVALALNPTAVDDASWVALNDEAATWEGSLASKAWRLLERHLERHDTDGTYRFRLVVLERTLATNRGAKIPTFLTDFFLNHDAHALVRTMIKFDRLDEAFKASLATIKSASTSSGLGSSCLPYSLFDQLLALKVDASSAEGLRERQNELRDALEARSRALDKAQTAALR